MNYAELLQSIQDFTENNETTFVGEIPTFVRQAEELIYRSVMLPELRKNVTANVRHTQTNQQVDCQSITQSSMEM